MALSAAANHDARAVMELRRLAYQRLTPGRSLPGVLNVLGYTSIPRDLSGSPPPMDERSTNVRRQEWEKLTNMYLGLSDNESEEADEASPSAQRASNSQRVRAPPRLFVHEGWDPEDDAFAAMADAPCSATSSSEDEARPQVVRSQPTRRGGRSTERPLWPSPAPWGEKMPLQNHKEIRRVTRLTPGTRCPQYTNDWRWYYTQDRKERKEQQPAIHAAAAAEARRRGLADAGGKGADVNSSQATGNQDPNSGTLAETADEKEAKEEKAAAALLAKKRQQDMSDKFKQLYAKDRDAQACRRTRSPSASSQSPAPRLLQQRQGTPPPHVRADSRPRQAGPSGAQPDPMEVTPQAKASCISSADRRRDAKGDAVGSRRVRFAPNVVERQEAGSDTSSCDGKPPAEEDDNDSDSDSHEDPALQARYFLNLYKGNKA